MHGRWLESLTSTSDSLILETMWMKVVTKRKGKEPPVQGAKVLQQTIHDIRGARLVPKGVYRFSSFEEADEWMMQAIVNTRARLKSKMS